MNMRIITVYVITDAQFDEVLRGMQALGFTQDSSILSLSISFIDHLCGTSRAMFYSKVYKKYHIVDNMAKEEPGVYIDIYHED